MPLSVTEIQTRIDAIRSSRDTGVLLVRHGDTSTQFRSLAEMDSIIASLEKQLAAAQGAVKPRVRYISQPSKGY